MQSKFVSKVAAGTIIGVLAGAMLLPNMDRSTKRRVRKAGKMVSNMAGDVFDNMKDYML
jgi:hypothetical protein